METVLNGELMAIVPKYIDYRGNCTILYSNSREPLILDKSIKTTLRLIEKHYMIDIRELKNRYASLVSSPNLVPIPLSKKDIFIPLKTRIPMYKNDGAFGYINMKYIEKIFPKKNITIVQLSNGINFKCLCSLSTTSKHIKNGNIISKCYEERAMKVAEEEIIYEGENSILVLYTK